MPTLYVLWSVKHGRWWMARALGYSETLDRAGLYTSEECDRLEYGSQRAGRFDQISVRIPACAVGLDPTTQR